MLTANKGEAPRLDGSALHIGIVQSRFNEGVTRGLLESCSGELAALGVQPANITHVTVPGALEIPLALEWMAASQKHDALIALGCVIRGETYHFELVANESAAGVSRVALTHGVPVANAILSTESLMQATVRQIEKGRDAARAAVEMALLKAQLA
jgi:6,7-dimethyl-8-ribityllumazine synthase